MAKHYPVEQRERAVKMVLDHLQEYRSVSAACQSIGPNVGAGTASLRRWVLPGPGRIRPAAWCHKVLRGGLKIRSRRPTRNAAAGCMFQL